MIISGVTAQEAPSSAKTLELPFMEKGSEVHSLQMGQEESLLALGGAYPRHLAKAVYLGKTLGWRAQVASTADP